MKLLIISGGSKGLGLSIINKLEKKNWKIIDFSRSGKKYNIKTDLSDSNSLLKTVKESLSQLDKASINKIYIISNAATITPIKKSYNITSEDVINNFTVNIQSPVILLNYLISFFRDLKIPKKIVNISSGAALHGYAGWSLYCASKAAMENYINSVILDEETEVYPFTIINFDPGIMDTDMQREIRCSNNEDFPQLERFNNFKRDNVLVNPARVANILITILEGNTSSGRYSVKDFMS